MLDILNLTIYVPLHKMLVKFDENFLQISYIVCEKTEMTKLYV